VTGVGRVAAVPFGAKPGVIATEEFWEELEVESFCCTVPFEAGTMLTAEELRTDIDVEGISCTATLPFDASAVTKLEDELELGLDFEELGSNEVVPFERGSVMEATKECCNDAELDEVCCVVRVLPGLDVVEMTVDEF